MGLFHTKSRWERIADGVGGLPKVVNSTLDVLDASKATKPAKAVKASPVIRSGLMATGGAVAVTLGSAVVSSLRKRDQGSENHS